MNPPQVCKVQMTLTVYMNLELLERGDLPIVLFLTLDHVYIINTSKSHLKAFLFSRAYDQSGLTVQEDYAL